MISSRQSTLRYQAATVCLLVALCVFGSTSTFQIRSIRTASSQYYADRVGPAEVELADRLHCLMTDPIPASFCRQDLPPQRRKIREEYSNTRSQCRWETTSPAKSYFEASYPEGKSVPYYMYTPASAESRFFGSGYFDVYGDPFIKESTLDRCEAKAQIPHQHWTLERFGPFRGHGGFDWHGFGWKDAGGFEAKLKAGEVYVTAFFFGPTDGHGNAIGTPPVHVHHMHVTSSQTHPFWESMSKSLWGARNTEGVVSAEFDIHGDRQCQEGLGGTDCLFREFPPGFGMRFSEKVDTFADVNDVREMGSAALEFYVEYAFKWTAVRQRPVGRFIGAAGSTFLHDDFFLRYSMTSPETEYLLWDQMVMPATVRIIHPFFHSHHKYTAAMYWFSGNASDLGLDVAPYNLHAPHANLSNLHAIPFNLTAANLTISKAVDHVLSHVEAYHTRCLPHMRCPTPPQLKCSLNLNRWDMLGNGELQERFHNPLCGSWVVQRGEINTILSFHKPREPLKRNYDFYMHSVLYAYYTSVDDHEPIPHAMVVMPLTMGAMSNFSGSAA